MEANRHRFGKGWHVLPDGRHILEDLLGGVTPELRRYVRADMDGAIRTKGDPATMRQLRDDYGESIEEASAQFGIPEHWIAGMVGIEAVKVRGSRSFDPFSRADEDHQDFRDMDERRHRVSFGLMQTLWGTAEEMLHRDGLEITLGIDDLHAGHLCVPHISIMLGTAYMAHQRRKLTDALDRPQGPIADGPYIVGGYNAGGLYATNRNVWNIRTYGVDRLPKWCAYANDWLALT